jgi:hypothetical protein
MRFMFTFYAAKILFLTLNNATWLPFGYWVSRMSFHVCLAMFVDIILSFKVKCSGMPNFNGSR